MKPRRPAHLAAFVLLVLLPLAWTPLTVDLKPQKALLFGLALPLCAFASRSLFPFALLSLGLLRFVLQPVTTWDVLAIAAAPTVFALLRSLVSDDLDRTLLFRLVRRVAIAESLLAIAFAFGLLPFDTSAFHLPYRVFVGTLGNPNHLAAYLLLALPLCAVDLTSARRADHLEALAAVALSSLVVLLSRSHLAALVLAVEAFFLAPPKLPRLARATLALLPIIPLVLHRDGFVRALEGRVYLHAVYGRGFSAVRGLDAGDLAARFLDWQAEHLLVRPEDARLWTYPEHPHDDLFTVLLVCGLLAGGCLILVALTRLTLENKLLPRAHRSAALLAALLLSLGGSLLASPVSLVMGLVVAALCLRPREPPKEHRWVPFTSALVASAWLLATSLEFVSASHHREALHAAMNRDLPRASRHVDAALVFPFEPGKLLHLKGRLLLEGARPRDATEALRAAAKRLPHPAVWKALVAADLTIGDQKAAKADETSWRFFRPNDPALVTFRR